MSELRVKRAAAILSVVLLVALFGGAAGRATAPSSTTVVAIYQSQNTTEHSNFTVSLEVSDSSGIQYVYFTFCQLSSPRCYLPVTMAPHGANWFVGTTNPMTQYPGMTPGVRAGYNITIVYTTGGNLTEPSLPNQFHNLTIAQSVTGEYMFEMTVVNPVYGLSGVVSDASTGSAVAGATVTVTPGNGTTTTTNSTGGYRFAGLPNGTYTVSVSQAGYRTSSVTVSVSGASVEKNITLSNQASPNDGGSGASGFGGWFTSSTGRLTLVAIVVVAILVGVVLGFARMRGPRGPLPGAGEGPAGPPQPQRPKQG